MKFGFFSREPGQFLKKKTLASERLDRFLMQFLEVKVTALHEVIFLTKPIDIEIVGAKF